MRALELEEREGRFKKSVGSDEECVSLWSSSIFEDNVVSAIISTDTDKMGNNEEW